MHKTKSLLFVLILFFVFSALNAASSLVFNPAVKCGQLDNGLTYYIQSNSEPKNRVSLRLVVNAGSCMEEEDQRGVAHFIEHLAFNGTKNFKKNEIISFIESVGMKFGADLNAYTSFEETVYMLEIPADDPAVLEKALLVLHDWASEVSFEEDEIEKERGVVKEEWRLRQGANQRIADELYNLELKDSVFLNRMPIGLMDVIDNVSRQRILDFYKKWYRPELMSVCLVGDLPQNVMEEEVKKIMSTIPASEKKMEKVLYKVPFTEKKEALVTADPEWKYSLVQVESRVKEEGPFDTEEELFENISLEMIASVINQRLSDISKTEASPFIEAYVFNSSYTNYTKFKSLGFLPKDDKALEALSLALTEIQRFIKFGMTDSEFERSKKTLSASLEKYKSQIEKIESSAYINELVSYSVNGDISLAPQNYYELSLKMLNKISREDIIRIAEKYFGNCGDYLFAVSNSSVKLPSKEEFLSVWKQTLNNEVTAYEEEKLPQELMTAPAVKGKIISKRKLKNVDAKEYIFENGARVIMKKTDFEKDRINMSVLSMGGYSLYPEEDIPSALVGENYLWYSGINGFDSSQVQKIISNKVFDANWGLHRWGEYFYGSGNHQDFELALQLMYQFFENPQFTDQGWNYVYQLYDLQANNFGSSIQDALSSQYKKFFKDDSYYASIIIDKEFMAKVDRSKAEKITKERFSNAADFTFIFTGDFNEKKLLELCKKYIGSLKGDKDKKEECNFIYFSEPSSIKTSVIKKGSEPQANVRLLFRKNIEPASDVTSSFIDNELAAQLAELLETRLREIIREDMSGTYGVGVSAFSDGYPQRQFTFEINFGCAPERVMELKDAVITAIKDMQKEVVAESYTNNLREIYKRNTEKSLRDNGWWSERIKGIYFDKSEPETAIDDIENVIPDMITPEKMKELLNLYFNTDAYLFGYLIPEK